jgi:hypothetical protein
MITQSTLHVPYPPHDDATRFTARKAKIDSKLVENETVSSGMKEKCPPHHCVASVLTTTGSVSAKERNATAWAVISFAVPWSSRVGGQMRSAEVSRIHKTVNIKIYTNFQCCGSFRPNQPVRQLREFTQGNSLNWYRVSRVG